MPITDGRIGNPGHFDYRPEAEQNRIRAHIENLQFEMSQARYDVRTRKAIYIHAYQTVEKRTGARIFLVTNLSPGERETLDQHGVEHRLLSFYDLQNQKEDVLERYLENDLSPRPRKARLLKPLTWDNATMDARKLMMWRRIKAWEDFREFEV